MVLTVLTGTLAAAAVAGAAMAARDSTRNRVAWREHAREVRERRDGGTRRWPGDTGPLTLPQRAVR
ncbi:hypothetical protein [Pseudonocardia phyllosphaerae]|uniref:hypothetical protein n=1 Tax=Pseudonocardia phyllosphaerae TaxID=3390502 RepID=UPI00397C4767